MAWVATAVAAGTVLSGKIASDGAKDATKAQIRASDEALALYEKNAGIATEKLEDATDLSIDTLKEGKKESEQLLKDSTDGTIKTLREGKDQAIADIVKAYGIQERVINEAAFAQNKYINAARESAASHILRGFSDGIAGIESARDLVNKVLQDSTSDAKEKLQIARGRALDAQERGLKNIRSDFEPFLKAGQVSAQELEKLVNDPNAQKEFITNNPFFQSLADDAEERLLSNQAARGRVGSGSTQEALQTELLKLGDQLLNTSINQRLSTASLGLSAANSLMSAETNVADAISAIEQETGRSLSDLTVQLGVNQGNNIRDSAKNIASLTVARGQALAENELTAGKSLADIEGKRSDQLVKVGEGGIERLTDTNNDFNTKIAGVQDAYGTNLVNLNNATVRQVAGYQNDLGRDQANVLTGHAAVAGDTIVGAGDAKAAGIVADTNIKTGVIKDIAVLTAKELEDRKTANAKE